MATIIYTRHARSRMRQHRISIDNVVETIAAPDQLLPGVKNRYNALKRIGNKIIRVTWVKENDRIVIITVSPRKCFQEEA